MNNSRNSTTAAFTIFRSRNLRWNAVGHDTVVHGGTDDIAPAEPALCIRCDYNDPAGGSQDLAPTGGPRWVSRRTKARTSHTGTLQSTPLRLRMMSNGRAMGIFGHRPGPNGRPPKRAVRPSGQTEENQTRWYSCFHGVPSFHFLVQIYLWRRYKDETMGEVNIQTLGGDPIDQNSDVQKTTLRLQSANLGQVLAKVGTIAALSPDGAKAAEMIEIGPFRPGTVGHHVA